MSSYDTGGPSRLVRATGTQAPRQQIGTLSSPGLIPIPPASDAAALLDQLHSAMVGVGNVASAFNEFNRQNEADQRRNAADQRREEADRLAEYRRQMAEKKAAAIYDRASANEDAANNLPIIRNQIQTGQLFTTSSLPPSTADTAPSVATPAFADANQETAFQAWYKPLAESHGLDANPDAPEHHYDYRRAFLEGSAPDPAPNGHWSSEFKLADHPNRFVDGVDTITGKDMSQSPATLQHQVAAWISERTKDGSDAYREQYSRRMQPIIEQEIIAKRTQDQREAVQALSDKLVRGVQPETDPRAIQSTLDEWTKINGASKPTPIEAATAVILPAYINAADAGDAQRMKTFASFLDPKLFEPQLRAGQIRYQEWQSKQTQQADTSFNDKIASLRLQGAPAQDIYAEIAKAPGVRDTVREVQKNVTAEWEHKRNEELDKAAKQQEINDVERAFYGQGRSMLDSNSLYALKDQRVQLKDGTPITLKADTAKQQILAEEFAAIDQAEKDPRAALNKKLLLSSQQGVLHEGWKQTLNAGFAATSTAAYFAANGKEPPALPAQATAAFNLYKQMKMFPGLLNQTGMDDQAKTMYERAYTMQQDPAFAGDDARTLAESVRRGNDPAHVAFTAAEKRKLDSSTSDLTDIPWSFRTALNGNEIKSELYSLASAKIEGGMNVEPAIKSALNDLNTSRVFIGAHSVNLSGLNVPASQVPDLEKAAASFIADYADTVGKKMGLDGKNLTLKPDRQTGIWTIRDASNNAPVPTVLNGKSVANASKVAITTDELLQRIGQMKKDAASAESNRILKAWQDRRATPSPEETANRYWSAFGT